MKSCPECGAAYDDLLVVCPEDNSTLVVISSAAETDPLVGKLLDGRFLLIDKLGQGGMGAVYKALHTKIDRHCAIKVLAPFTADSEGAIARFKREARMASQINNQHAVTIYDFGASENGALYLAMEFVDGKPLSGVLAEQPKLSLDRVIGMTAQIAEALDAAHNLGIVHRDLKPDNIMVARKGDEDFVKVLDFGIAKAVGEDVGDNLTKTGFVLGTPVYMSPEQLSGEKLDARSDLYSLALIVYEMLSGRLPFEGENLQAVMMKRVLSDPIPLRAVAPELSESIEAAVMAGLARDRERRTQNVVEFVRQLQRAFQQGTQVLSSRGTEKIADQPMAGRETVAWNADQPSSPAATGASSIRRGAGTTPIEEDDQYARTLVTERFEESSRSAPIPPAPPTSAPASRQPETGIPSPSAFVTKPGIDALGPAVATPSHQPIHAEPPPTRLAAFPRGKSRVAAMVTSIVVGVAAVGGGGYYAYTSIFGQSATPNATPNGAVVEPPVGPDPATVERARALYEGGKQLQVSADNLGIAGRTDDALRENDRAIEEYRKAIAIMEEYPEAHENLGVALMNAGKARGNPQPVEESLSHFEKAIAQYEKPSSQVVINYAFALLELKRFNQAARALERAIQLNPEDADLYFYLGFPLYHSGEREAANDAYRRYLQISPGGPHARDARDILAGRSRPQIKGVAD